MLEQLKYKNHINEVFEFGKDGIFVNTNDLHDYEWTVTKKGNRIAALNRGTANRKLPVVIICDTEEKGIAARNKLMEVVEKDVLAMKHGQIILGDYYFKCFVTKSQKKDYLKSNRYMELTLTLTTDFPYWVKESTMRFGNDVASASAGKNLDFAHDLPYDFYSGFNMRDLNNTGFVGTNFKIIIYGWAKNPAVFIGGHEYGVNCEIGENEYLTIDSLSKQVYLTGKTGEITNMFKDRNKDSYIFEKIPPGNNHVSWSGDFGFDIILMEERSEPKWT